MFEHICNVICKGEGITFNELLSESRKQELVYTRQLIMFFSFLMDVGTYEKIGDKFGKDHATVMHAVKVINNYIDTDKIKKETIESYSEQLGLVRRAYDLTNEMEALIKPLQDEAAQLEQRLINIQIAIKNLLEEIKQLKP